MNTKVDKIKDFTDLIAWQEGHALVILIYNLTKAFPKDETFSLISQMRRSATSITANIAEGFGRQSYKEKLQFYYISQGSLIELKNFMIISRDIGYINEIDFDMLFHKSSGVHKLLQGLITKTKTFIISK